MPSQKPPDYLKNFKAISTKPLKNYLQYVWFLIKSLYFLKPSPVSNENNKWRLQPLRCPDLTFDSTFSKDLADDITLLNPFPRKYRFLCRNTDGVIEFSFLNQLGYFWVASIISKIRYKGEPVVLKSINNIRKPRYSVDLTRAYNEDNVLQAFNTQNFNRINVGKWELDSYEATENGFKCALSVPNLDYQFIKSNGNKLDLDDGPIQLVPI